MKFSIKDFFSKCDQRFLGTWSYLLKKSLMKNFIFLCSENVISHYRSRHSQMFFKIGVLKNLAILTWKKETPTQAFSCKYCEIFNNNFANSTNFSWFLLISEIFTRWITLSKCFLLHLKSIVFILELFCLLFHVFCFDCFIYCNT